MIGLGTVGTGVWQVLRRNQALIAARAGRRIEIVAVAVRTEGMDISMEELLRQLRFQRTVVDIRQKK